MEKYLLIAFLIMSAGHVYADDDFNGHDLDNWRMARDRIKNRVTADAFTDGFDNGKLLGIVIGVNHVSKRVCFTGEYSQAIAIVNNYINAHPEQWDKPAGALVEKALIQYFPCR